MSADTQPRPLLGVFRRRRFCGPREAGIRDLYVIILEELVGAEGEARCDRRGDEDQRAEQ